MGVFFNGVADVAPLGNFFAGVPVLVGVVVVVVV